MSGAPRFSPRRFGAIVAKEFIQMRRDRLTFGMMIGIPILQLILFGFAINSNPKHLPTAVLSEDNDTFARTLIWALRQSDYFSIVRIAEGEAEIDRLLRMGEVLFVVHIPRDFTRDVLRGQRPVCLLEVDATDPAATGNAIAAVGDLIDGALERDLKGPLAPLRGRVGPVDLQIHRHYNPEIVTQYNIVPGLMGVVLTMTMVIITALAITRERERGTMENLLATPARPAEVMVGKLVPYIMVGYLQTLVILAAARWVFVVPMLGNLWLLLGFMLVFIAANLAVGITFSTLARNQLQAMQMSFFFFLPSILLSGFMFPFRGMPVWAQYVGEAFPLTHFLRLVRGVLLKGNGFTESWHHVWPIAVFMTLALAIGILRYRRTLD